MSEVIVEFRGVYKAFGSKIIYEDLNLTIHRGETLCIIGGSGTGKSVMMKMLVGLLRPDRGEIFAFGREISKLSEKEMQEVRRNVAMLFQGGALFDSLTVAENIKYPLIEHKWGTTKEQDERVEEVLAQVGLPGISHQKPSELSGGMRKRVALARSIAIKPKMLLYDEPTTGLDPLKHSKNQWPYFATATGTICDQYGGHTRNAFGFHDCRPSGYGTRSSHRICRNQGRGKK